MTSQSFLIFVVIIKFFFNLIRKKIYQLSFYVKLGWTTKTYEGLQQVQEKYQGQG